MSHVTDLLNDSSSVQHTAPLAACTGGTEVNDPVHGRFFLGLICSLAEGTAAVQRLRNLKQLGPTCYGPYPAAVHTRHEHSLGVAHLAQRCFEGLAAGSAEDIRQVDVELTALAGLCHDLGHGPFSHSFDACLDSILGHGYDWHHEVMSCRLLDYVLSEAQLDLDSQQVLHVQDLIDNSQYRHLREPMQPEQAWRLQVVSNHVNGLDMDKIDYEVRDSLMAGVTLKQDCSRFIPLVTQHCKVLSGHICYDQQQQQHVAAVYDARAVLHEHVYQHRQAKAAQLVISDALAAAEPVLQLKVKVNDPEAFLTLDDTIINQIQSAPMRKDTHPCMKQAASILWRLQRRDLLYTLAAEAELPTLPLSPQRDTAHGDRYSASSSSSGSSSGGSGSSGSSSSSSQLNVDDLVRCQQVGGVGGVVLRSDDLRLQFYNINYCFGLEDPLDRVFLYDASSSTITRKASKGLDRSGMRFLSNRVRVYVTKQCDTATERQTYAAAATAAFSSALRLRYGDHYKLLHSSSSSSRGQPNLRSAAADVLRQRPAQQRYFVNTNANGSKTNSSHVTKEPGRGVVLRQGLPDAATTAAAAAAAAPAGEEVAYGNGTVKCWSEGS